MTGKKVLDEKLILDFKSIARYNYLCISKKSLEENPTDVFNDVVLTMIMTLNINQKLILSLQYQSIVQVNLNLLILTPFL